jgi:ABC-2 type transport system ATP-binding protein
VAGPERAQYNAAMTQPIIEVRDLRKSFAGAVAVDGISFVAARGAITGLLGGNGAGKTTTIGMLLGLILPSSGSIAVMGEDMVRHRHRVLPRMNFSSPYVDFPARLTVRETLEVFGRLYGLRDRAARIARLAGDLHLRRFLEQRAGSLSAGQKTRLALAKALINTPDLLLLDEPTASLDPDTGDWIRAYLETYRRETGATILLASHNMAEVERLCDEVLMMRAGRIVDRGTPDALRARFGRANMEQVFLDIARAGGTTP